MVSNGKKSDWKMNADELTEDEKKILKIVAEREHWTEYTYKRKSDRDYDIEIEGKEKIGEMECSFGAWLRLSIIHSVDWTQNKIWRFSDGYGRPGFIPSQSYDWSGIRDSSDVAIGKMTRVAVKELLKSDNLTKPKRRTKKVEVNAEEKMSEKEKREWAERWAGRLHAKGS